MKRYNFYMMIMAAMMCMASVNANAQGRRGGNRNGYRIEMNGSSRHNDVGRSHDMGRHNYMGRSHDMGRHNYMGRSNGMVARPHRSARPHVVVEHRPARHIYIGGRSFDPRWEGCIRYKGGRWGYLRGSDWYWYDRYYEPDYYFVHPVAHFHHCHISPEAAVVGVVGAVALGALVSALSY